MTHNDLRTAWDTVAARYQARSAVAGPLVHYGPWAPAEPALQLLGDVRGLHILELGCGGGQTSVAFAQQGAMVTGLDLSAAQLAFARQLAQDKGVNVTLIHGAAENLSSLADASVDLIFATYLFPYLAELGPALGECRRVLRGDGRLVFSQDHPLRVCFYEAEEDEFTLYPSRSYFDTAPLRWQFPDHGAWLQTYHYTITDWLTSLACAGLSAQRIIEPPVPAAVADKLWPDQSPLFSMRNLPHAIIWIVTPNSAATSGSIALKT
jgi:SAM-dependent methyltransferase